MLAYFRGLCIANVQKRLVRVQPLQSLHKGCSSPSSFTALILFSHLSFTMSKPNSKEFTHRLPQHVTKTSSIATPKMTTVGVTSKHSRSSDQQSTSSRSRSPIQTSHSPPAKKTHRLSDSASDSDPMNISIDHEENLVTTPETQFYSFLLTKYDTKFQAPKCLLQQLLKYVQRDKISEIIPTKNGIIIKSPEPNLAKLIRNKYSFEMGRKHSSQHSTHHQ